LGKQQKQKRFEITKKQKKQKKTSVFLGRKRGQNRVHTYTGIHAYIGSIPEVQLF
jgi:hypothetical protein